MKYEYRFPDIGEGIHEGTIIKWLVDIGDNVNEGDSIAEVETDKVTTEIPTPKSGKVLELMADAGDVINVGEVFITIDTSGEADETEAQVDANKEIVEEETAGVVGEVIVSSEEIPPSTEGIVSTKKAVNKKKILATPVARALAKDLGVDINEVIGTGPGGRVMKEDIRNFKDSLSEIEEPKSKVDEVSSDFVKLEKEVSKGESITRVPLTRIRKTIAEKMTQSRFTIPHTTAMDEIDVSKLDDFRKKYKSILKEEDVNLTYLPFIIKAAITALKILPEFNASLDEENNELILKHFYHIGIATDTERGLMVPVIRNVDRKSIVELAKAIVDLGTRAKENKIDLSELKGSTFSITNYGSIGGYYGIPIINYPESAILGLGRVVKKPIVRDDEIVIAKILPVSLSYDHRIIDGASGARFLNILRELLTDPELLLLKS
ncbi:dihydrolipoamide acetyltransferase family protein [Paratissierella segnis]|uniref:Dihydrolipoamide acetyltransferase component of pyruvate dehydrogenase complex n=1 Tax=Paratissierella segnis TaxID=2763679 RepID=A0A926IJW0_9FIRM|nr:dihydrolipoamide acetyltransferase family protein [Paratissierella segnis]MBC8587655.1 2-oxo acid dehydrogenase subunit E2 [Paratissierella segnis]